MNILALLCFILLATTGQGCINGTFELQVTATMDEYYVQYCHNNTWRYLCTGDGRWSRNHAAVVCRQLGYSGLRRNSGRAPRLTGLDNNNSFFQLPQTCNGTETNIQQCTGRNIRAMSDPCSKRNGNIIYGFIKCTPACTDGEIRLTGGSTNSEGRLEVCADQRWRTVCNTNQDGLAEAVCNQLGFPAEKEAQTVIASGLNATPFSNCTVQNGSVSCARITDATSCDSTMNVTCVSQEIHVMREVNKARNECDARIMGINGTLQQWMTNATESSLTVQELKANITLTLEQCSADKTDRPTQGTQPVVEQANNSTPALGAVNGLLVVVLMIAAVGWIVTCVKFSRSGPSRKNTAGVHKIESFSLQQAVFDEATPTQDTYRGPLGPNYDLVTANTEDDTYDAIDLNQHAPPTVELEPAHLTVAGAGKKYDDFYDAEEHTYAMVDKKGKKAPKDEKEERVDPPVYENAMCGDNLWEGEDVH